MTDPHDTQPHPPTDTHQNAATTRITTTGDRQPSMMRVAATTDGNLSPQLARMILDTYTSVGDVALDIDDDAVFAATAAQAGRRHHALGGAQHLDTMDHVAGYIDMILLHWPRPTIDPRLLLIACRSLLRNAGVLVIAVTTTPLHRISHLRALQGAASTAGLHLIDHIAAIDPATGAATAMVTPGSGTARPRSVGDTPETGRIPVPHSDLLILGPVRGLR